VKVEQEGHRKAERWKEEKKNVNNGNPSVFYNSKLQSFFVPKNGGKQWETDMTRTSKEMAKGLLE